MQNRYFGDIGDFSKYGMMRVIQKSGLAVGLNWYLYPDETHNNDGKHLSYLHKDRHRLSECDPELYAFLKLHAQRVQSGEATRNIETIEKSGLLPNTCFFSELLFHNDWRYRITHRTDWHNKSIKALSPAQVIFYDPDNGFEIPSVKATQKHGGKYALLDEVKKQFHKGKSLVVYNHGPLWFKKGELEPYVDKILDRITTSLGESTTVVCLQWVTTAKRFYFLIIQPEHKAPLESSIELLTSGHWANHFRVID